MATKPTARQEQGPVDPLDEWVSASRVQADEGATPGHKCPLQDKKAPKAEPEEDIDDLEPAARVKTLQENQTVSVSHMVDPESTGISQCTPGEAREAVTESERLSGSLQTQEEPGEPADLFDDAFPPPPSPSASSSGEYCEKEVFSSLEAEVGEGISDGEVISDPTEDLASLDSRSGREWPNTSHLIEPVDQEVDVMSEEATGDDVTAEGYDTPLSASPDGISNSKTGNNLSQPAHYSPSDSNNSDDVNAASSPPFADESEDEEELCTDTVSYQQQWNTPAISSEAFQTPYSARGSVSTDQDPDAAPPASPAAKQQEELLPQSQPELAPKGANQEAAQQVLGQGSPPLSTVAMELSNQGGAGSQGSGCVVAVRERHSRAGGRTEGENEQTGGEEGQKENEPAGQQHGGGPSGNSQTIRIREEYSRGVSLRHSRHARMEHDSGDDSQSDSGVSADFSPCSTLEGTTTISTGTPASISKETPIEREIRRAVEREHSLRRSRGLPNPPTSPEYVEIPLRKSVLCQSLTAKSEWDQGKDREFAGKMMQNEIHEAARREQDLVKLGKVPGFYDKGTVRQIKEKKQLFEAFQTPSDSTFTISTRSKAPSWSSASDVSTLENQEDTSSQASTVERRHSSDLLSPTQSPNPAKGGGLLDCTPRGLGFPEGTGYQVIIIENDLSVPAHKRYHVKPEAEARSVVDCGLSSSRTGGHDGRLREGKQERKEEEEEEEVAPKENPFFKLRSSTNLVKVKQDIQEAQEREKELRKQRISLYGGSGGAKGGEGGGGGRPMLSSSLNGLVVPDTPGSSSRAGAGPSAARQSVGKSCVWPPALAEEEKINRPEVPQSPRTPRQKTPLVQRWESGLVNGHDNEDD